MHCFNKRNGLLQVITFLPGYPNLVSLHRYLDFDLRTFHRFGNFASQIGVIIAAG